MLLDRTRNNVKVQSFLNGFLSLWIFTERDSILWVFSFSVSKNRWKILWKAFPIYGNLDGNFRVYDFLQKTFKWELRKFDNFLDLNFRDKPLITLPVIKISIKFHSSLNKRIQKNCKIPIKMVITHPKTDRI